MHRSPAGVAHSRQEPAREVRDLFGQQASRLWNADSDLDWETGPRLPERTREPWFLLLNIFAGLETMGLDVLQIMTSKATRRLSQPDVGLYLAAQAHDEARHVYVLDRYLDAAGGHHQRGRVEDFLITRYGTMASHGLYSVENWLTSTLFSENFAALFLERAVGLPENDPLGDDMFRLILRDEVRHVDFLNTVLPDLISDTSRPARAYLWQSQMVMIGAVSLGLRRVAPAASEIGLDIDDFKRQLIANLDAQYRDCGIDEFLQARTSQRVMNWLV